MNEKIWQKDEQREPMMDGVLIEGTCMRVTILTQETYPTTRPMLSELWNKEFVARGHSVRWIISPAHNQLKFSQTSWNGNAVQFIPNYKSWCRLFRPIAQLFVWLKKITLVARIVKRNECDFIHVHNSILDAMIVCIIGVLRPVHISFALTFPFYLLYRKKTGLLQRIRSKMYDHALSIVLKRTEVFFPISNALQSVLANEFMVGAKVSVAVSESASTYFLEKKSPQSVSNKFIYLGEISSLRRLELLLDAFERVYAAHPEAELMLVGSGVTADDIPALQKYADTKLSKSAIHFLGSVPHDDVPDLVTQCLAGLSPIPPIEMYLVSTPTKCVEYLSLGIPTIANKEIPDQEHIILQSGGGFAVEYSAAGFSSAMITLLDDKAGAMAMGRKGKEWLKNNRTFSGAAEQIEQAYQQLLKR